DRLRRRLSQSLPSPFIIQQQADSVGQSLNVGGRNKPTVDSLPDHFGNRPGPRRHARAARRHGFDQGNPQPFIERGEDKQIATARVGRADRPENAGSARLGANPPPLRGATTIDDRPCLQPRPDKSPDISPSPPAKRGSRRAAPSAATPSRHSVK